VRASAKFENGKLSNAPTNLRSDDNRKNHHLNDPDPQVLMR
jgi:hypothetical protein